VRVLRPSPPPTPCAWRPSAYIDDAGIAAWRRVAGVLRAVASRDLCEVLRVLVEDDIALVRCPSANGSAVVLRRIEPPAPGATRVAFLNHFVLPDRELVLMESSLGRLSPTGDAPSSTGCRADGPGAYSSLRPESVWRRSTSCPSLPWIRPPRGAPPQRERELVVQRIQEGLELGQRLGCTVGGLGAYTSIVTADGTALVAPPA